jgi:ethanolamine ammonia-lyase large subunit/ethanolamine ammonia-lyase small subunit
VVVLIGERPGLSASDSLGCYITFGPEPGLPDSRRNCLSNIRESGLAIETAAGQMEALLRAMFAQRISGVGLRRDALPDRRTPELPTG